MSLSRTDLQLIREILQPEFNGINKRIDEFKEYVDKRFEKQDQRFAEIDQRFEEQNEKMLDGFRQIVEEVYDDFHKVDVKIEDHEVRITQLEA